MNGRIPAGVVLAAVLALLVGCGGQAPPVAAPQAPSVSSAPSAPSASSAPARLALVDADRFGAIVSVRAGATGEHRGVRRDGSVAWVRPADPAGPDPVRCLRRCPDAVLSGGPAAPGSAGARTPPGSGGAPTSLLIVDGQVQEVGGGRLLAATGSDDYVLDGERELTVRRPGQPELRLPALGRAVGWTQAGGVALLLTGTERPRQARWVDLGHEVAVGPPVEVEAAGSCVAPDGRLALLLGQRPALLDRDGRLRTVTDLFNAGACAWSAAGVIVAEYGASDGGVRTRLRLLDRDGAELWRRTLHGEVGITADANSATVAFVAGGELTELVGASPARTVPSVQAARYTPEGELAVVDQAGAVRWMPGRP